MSQPQDIPSTPGNGPGDEIGFLAELCQVVASNTELRPILDWIVQKTTSRFGADEGSIKLAGVEPGQATAHTLIRKHQPGLDSGSWENPVTTCVMGYLQIKGGGFASSDLLDDPRFPALRRMQSRVRAVLAVPLRVEGRITGMLAVTNRAPGRLWTSGDLRLLEILATHSAGVIEQARLRAEALVKVQLEQEMKLRDLEMEKTRERQMSLVPTAPLVCGPWEVHGRVVPARRVGGDYFDYFLLGEDRFAVAIADVSGKGLPAAFLMANVQGSLRAFCDGQRAPAEAVRLINRRVTSNIEGGQFITLFYGEVDCTREVLRFVDAGHNYPMLRRADGSTEELRPGGLLLGLTVDAEYDMGETAFAPGDALLMYSDGISEAADSRGELYGEDRLSALWRDCAGAPTAGVIDRLLAEVARFRGSAGQSDDMTALVVGPRGG